MDQEKEQNIPQGTEASSPVSESTITPSKMETPAATPMAEGTKDPFFKTGAGMAIIFVLIIALGIGAYTYMKNYHMGDVAATVNGERLYVEEVDQNTERILQIASLQGQDTSDPGLRASIEEMSFGIMVDNMILVQAAEEAGHSVSEEEVEARYQEEIANYESEEVFLEQLATIDLSIEALMENIHDELLVKKYFDEEIGEEALAVSEEEIQERYDAFIAANPDAEDAPALEDIVDQVEETLVEEKRQAEVQEIMNQLKEEAEIVES